MEDISRAEIRINLFVTLEETRIRWERGEAGIEIDPSSPNITKGGIEIDRLRNGQKSGRFWLDLAVSGQISP